MGSCTYPWLIMLTFCDFDLFIAVCMTDSSSSSGKFRMGLLKSKPGFGILNGTFASWSWLKSDKLAKSAFISVLLSIWFSGTVLLRSMTTTGSRSSSSVFYAIWLGGCEAVLSKVHSTEISWDWLTSWNMLAGSGTLPHSLKFDSLIVWRGPFDSLRGDCGGLAKKSYDCPFLNFFFSSLLV